MLEAVGDVPTPTPASSTSTCRQPILSGPTQIQPVAPVLATVANVFPAVTPILETIQHVLAPVADVLELVTKSALNTRVAPVFEPVQPGLVPVEHIFPPIAAVFPPVADVLDSIAHNGTPSDRTLGKQWGGTCEG